MKRRLTARGVSLCLTTAVATSLVAGTAWAYYRASITPTTLNGGASAPTKTVTLTATGSSTALMYPGGPDGTVTITVANPYAKPMTVRSISGSVTGIPCANPDLTVVTPPASEMPFTVPANSQVSRTLTAVRMGLASTNDCQGDTISMSFTVQGRI